MHFLVQTGVCHLTLPPEILPVHLPVQPAWTPGPGSCHYGTAGGHSRPATEKKTTVRHWSDAITVQNVKHGVESDRKPQNHAHVRTHKPIEIQIWGRLAAWYLLSYPLTVDQHTRWICRGMICLGGLVISWMWSKRWGMLLITPPPTSKLQILTCFHSEPLCSTAASTPLMDEHPGCLT